jgi:hypothetical protein
MYLSIAYIGRIVKLSLFARSGYRLAVEAVGCPLGATVDPLTCSTFKSTKLKHDTRISLNGIIKCSYYLKKNKLQLYAAPAW